MAASPVLEARAAVNEAVARVPPGARIVDLGAGGRRITADTFTVDGDPACKPDLVCDLHRVPLEDGSFDLAFCTGTLEHVLDPERAAREMVRITKPGGLVFIDVPFMQPQHVEPHDYRRWTLPGLRKFCRELGLEEIEAGVNFGPGSTLTWVASEYANVALGGGKLGSLARFSLRFLLRPILWMDPWIARRRGADKLAAGVFVLARKPVA